jgi:hypothetical protein
MLQARFLDGRSTRVRHVELSLAGAELVIRGEDVDLRVPVAQVRVDERLGRAARRLRFPDGTCCEVSDLESLDELLVTMGHRDGWVDRVQRSSRHVLIAGVACVLLAAIGYQWILPWGAAYGARHLPPILGKSLTAQTLSLLDGQILEPSKIAAARRQSLSTEFRALRLPEGGHPQAPLVFRRSVQLGANAFTLPDGTIILLDDLITCVGEDREILAVLAHELGHAHGRHGLQMLLRSSVLGAFLTIYVGDISHLLAAAPAALLQARYSQDFEQQADAYGARLLLLNGLSPALLADALMKLSAARPDQSKGGYLSSHPSTAERLRRLRGLDAADTGD